LPGNQTRTLQDMVHFTGWHGRSFKFCTFLSDQDLSSHTKCSVPRQAPQAWYLLPHSFLQNLVILKASENPAFSGDMFKTER
jgi:hypothetical protein